MFRIFSLKRLILINYLLQTYFFPTVGVKIVFVRDPIKLERSAITDSNIMIVIFYADLACQPRKLYFITRNSFFYTILAISN